MLMFDEGADHHDPLDDAVEFAAASDAGIPLMLACHTHGGQVALRNKPQKNASRQARRCLQRKQSNAVNS